MPFVKGQSGNPGKVFRKDNQPDGRGRKPNDLRRYVAECLAHRNERGETALQEILEQLVKQAISGNLKAAEMLLDRAYGKPKQYIDHTSDGNEIKQPATIVFVND